jgi:uncharacterized membrane protein (DUF106 family)
MMQEQLEISREQFKPMAFILLVSVPIFLWLLFKLPIVSTSQMIVFPFIGAKGLSMAALGPIPAWIFWYMICSLSFSQIIRKSLNIGGI